MGMGVSICLGAVIFVLGVMSAMVSAQLREQQRLVSSLTAARQHVRQLKEINTEMTERIEAARRSMAATVPEKESLQPSTSPESLVVGGQGGNEPASDGPEWVAVEAVTRHLSSHAELTYRLSNPSPGKERIQGRTLVVFGSDDLDTNHWESRPNVPLNQGRPEGGTQGSPFAIRNFKNVRVLIPDTRTPDGWSFVTVYVFDKDGRLRLAQHHSLSYDQNDADTLAKPLLGNRTEPRL